MQGKTVVATGATSGIGAAAVEALARQGARIVFVARNPARAEATRQRLEAAAPGLGHRAYFADLSLMAQTKRIGAEIAAAERRIDVLVNNAGALFGQRQVTLEGLEMTFALNHMSYFVLTGALLECVKTAKGRIVSTTSAAHRGLKLDFDDLQATKASPGMGVYGRSKLCNILFTRELARRLAGTGVTANSLHPGVVASRFADESGGWTAWLLRLARPFFISPEQGADTLVWLASAPEIAGVTGGYFARRKPAALSAAAQDDGAARRLWDVSEKLSA